MSRRDASPIEVQSVQFFQERRNVTPLQAQGLHEASLWAQKHGYKISWEPGEAGDYDCFLYNSNGMLSAHQSNIDLAEKTPETSLYARVVEAQLALDAFSAKMQWLHEDAMRKAQMPEEVPLRSRRLGSGPGEDV